MTRDGDAADATRAHARGTRMRTTTSGVTRRAPSMAEKGLMPKSRWSRRTSARQPRSSAMASKASGRVCRAASACRRCARGRRRGRRASSETSMVGKAARRRARRRRRCARSCARRRATVAAGAQRGGVEAARIDGASASSAISTAKRVDAQADIVADGGEEPFAKRVDQAVGGRRVVEHASHAYHIGRYCSGSPSSSMTRAAGAGGRVLRRWRRRGRAPSATSRRRTPGR